MKLPKVIANYLFVRHRHNWVQLIRFGLVGVSGVLVNAIIYIAASKAGPNHDAILFSIPLTHFNVRWLHLFSTVAFVIANLWNFQLNRSWTFKTSKHSGWMREYWPFMAVGFGAQLVTMLIETLLTNPTSMIALPTSVFTNESGLTNQYYWAHIIAILVTVPLTFVLNKLWTFSAVRHRRTHPNEILPMVGPVVAGDMVAEDGIPFEEHQHPERYSASRDDDVDRV